MADEIDPIPEGVTLPDPIRSIETLDVAPIEPTGDTQEVEDR